MTRIRPRDTASDGGGLLISVLTLRGAQVRASRAASEPSRMCEGFGDQSASISIQLELRVQKYGINGPDSDLLEDDELHAARGGW